MTQPEALRLADALMALHEAKRYHPSGPGGQMCGSEQYRLVATGLAFEDLQNAAAELRRLYADNEKKSDAIQRLWKERDELRVQRDALLEALQLIADVGDRAATEISRAAIAKAEGKT